MITFEQARQIVRKAHQPAWNETGLQEYVVARYGGQDATDYLIVHGERGSIDDVTLPNGEPYQGIIGGPVTLVNKTTGRIQDVGHLLMFDRLDRMESIGTWPPGMGVGK